MTRTPLLLTPQMVESDETGIDWFSLVCVLIIGMLLGAMIGLSFAPVQTVMM